MWNDKEFGVKRPYAGLYQSSYAYDNENTENTEFKFSHSDSVYASHKFLFHVFNHVPQWSP